MVLCKYSNCEHIPLYNVKYTTPNIRHLKITLVNITTNLIQEVAKYWEAVKFIMASTNFPDFNILFESLSFIIGNKYCQLFSLREQVHLVILEKISGSCPSLKNNYLSVLSQKNKVA